MKVKLKHINKVRKRLADGGESIHYYHRKTGRKIEGVYGSPDFLLNYAQAAKHYESDLNTFSGIIELFLADEDYLSLAIHTRKDYRRHLDSLKKELGKTPIHFFNDVRIRQKFFKWRKEMEDRPRTADMGWSVLRRVLSWAYDHSYISVNHAVKPKRLYKSDRSEIIWTEDHIEAFASKAPTELMQALALAMFTGQRQGDLLKLTWANYDGELISLRQGKTGVRVNVPVIDSLKLILDSMDRNDLIILKSINGKPWKADHFRHQWRKYTLAAELDGLHFHDLRGTAVTLLHEAACTNHEIATITGHSLKTVDAILDTYSARTKKVALSAMKKLENELSTKLQTEMQTIANRTSEKGNKRS